MEKLAYDMTHMHESYQYAFEISCIHMQKSLGYWVKASKQTKIINLHIRRLKMSGKR